jgi:formate dehydrogenase subunit gamma
MLNSVRPFAAALVVAMLCARAFAQGTPAPDPAPPAAPAISASAAPLEPKPEDSNAQRAKSQPLNNAPFWRAVRESGHEQGVTTVTGRETGTLIQSFTQYPGSRVTNAGEAWRQVRNNWIIPYGAALLFVTLLALAIFHFTRGPIRLHGAETGRKIERFTPFERATHWSNALAFVTLALSGIVMAFGKFFLLPVLGSALFGWLTYMLKTVHNFVGPLFVVTTLFMIFTFIRSNWPRAEDLSWLRHGGGLFGGKEPASHRFNAGEKAVFWGGVLLLGSIVIGSGLFLDKLLPGFVYTRGEMQIAHMVHAVATLLMMAMILGHIYIGTLGMTGAYKAMREGYVDETWAREHHRLWYDDIEAGKIPAQRSAPPDASDPARPVTAQGTSA